MNPNPLKEGVLTDNSAGIGTVTPKMVRQRAAELAIIDGHSEQEVSKSECEEARRELTGEPDPEAKEGALESVPESERWNLVPGSTGHKAPVPASEDEDEEGRSDNERLVEEGIAEAEHDHMVQAARAAEKKDGREPWEEAHADQGNKTILASLKPNALLVMFNTPLLKGVAEEVEETIVKITKEAGSTWLAWCWIVRWRGFQE
jgi:hypothetical protein